MLWIAPACDEARHRVCLQLVPSGWPRLILAAPGGELLSSGNCWQNGCNYGTSDRIIAGLHIRRRQLMLHRFSAPTARCFCFVNVWITS